jgi:hypothetical protein
MHWIDKTLYIVTRTVWLTVGFSLDTWALPLYIDRDDGGSFGIRILCLFIFWKRVIRQVVK